MSKGEINAELYSIYCEKQDRIKRTKRAQLDKALEDEDFKRVYSKRQDLIVENAKRDFIFEDDIKKLKSVLVGIIKSHNLDFSVEYECPKCKDTGYVNKEMCECKKREKIRLLKKYSGLPKNAKFTFTNDSVSIQSPQTPTLKLLYSKAKEWCDHFDSSDTDVFLLNGGVGVGKSTLSYTICNYLINKGYYVKYISAFDLNNIIIDKQFNRLANENDYLDLYGCELLVIDDLGTEGINSIGLEHLLNIINNRVNDGKKTFISTNLNLEQLTSTYGERFVSRITNKNYAFVPKYMEGEDLRKLK